VRVRLSLSAAFACLLLTVASGHAQSPPPILPPLSPGFVPPYEIMRTVRAAGFDPLSPPLREGATYVLRATDYRGILMRVVIDAHTGAIRDANRIVPGPGAYAPAAYGPYGPPPPYGAPPYGASPYDDGPPPYGTPMRGDPAASEDPDDEPGFVPAHPPAGHPATRASVTILPPMPRPRPAELVSGKPGDDVKAPPPNVKPDARLDIKPDPKSEPKSEVTTAAPVVAPIAPSATAKPVKPPPSPPIND
jgi:hypothetical protein